MNRRNVNSVFKISSVLAVGICACLLFFLFGVIAWNGISALNFQFLISPSENFGAEGGVIYQIAGSVLLILGAAVLVLPIALGTAIFKSEYLSSKKLKSISNVLIFGLNGIPSVIFGIFSLVVFTSFFDMGISWFVGSITLAMMILPTVILSTYQTINSVPVIYKESAAALGLNKWQVITKVLVPQGISGAITGLLIGLARAIGETAPIMFVATAFSGVELPSSLLEPVSALPTHILALAQQATNPQAVANAWGASFILVLLVLAFGLTGLYFRIKTKKMTA